MFRTIVGICTLMITMNTIKSTIPVLMVILMMFQNTGIFKVIVMDNGSNFCSDLTTEFLTRLGVSPRFVAPYLAQTNGLVKRFNSSFKSLLHFAMHKFGRSWHKAIPFLVWVLRESPNATTGVSPLFYSMAYILMVYYFC